ncbi:hypothetical protein [Thermosediminibacter litoriperuensis]|nr:hypothetical protein [Thermosediminibacter litoriperuensis]
MATIYVRMSHYARTLYFTDLIGAIAFGLLTFLILDNYGMIISLLFLCMALFIIQMLFSYTYKNLKVFLLSALLVAATVSVSTLNLTDFERHFGELLAIRKLKLYGIEKDEKTTIEYTKWDSFSRTDVVDTGDAESKIIFMDGGAASEMYRFDGNPDSMSWLKSTPGFLPFTLQKQPKTLVIGPGGGKDILLALLAGSEDITAVEINKSSIQAAKKFAPFTGDIYNLPQVKTFVGDGRNFVEQAKEKYDTIFMSLVMTEAAGSGGLALTENYIYTKEAILKYFEHLTEDGQLVFAAHDERDMTRIVTTALAVFESLGIPYRDAIRHIGIVSKRFEDHDNDGKHFHYPSIVIRKKPFTPEQGAQYLKTALKYSLEPVFIPWSYEGDKFPLAEFTGIGDIVKFSSVDTRPTTDDRPFFYHFSYGLPNSVRAVLFLVIYVLLVYFAPHYKNMDRQERSLTNYFFLIGIGFMALEISLVQKNILLLGHPSTSFLATVSILVVACSLGSLAGKRFKGLKKDLPVALAFGIVMMVILYRAVFPNFLGESFYFKLAIMALILIPIGSAMGSFFPAGIERVHQLGKPSLIPLMWGINGVASLLGSTLAIGIAGLFGFTYSLLLSATAYFLLTFFIRDIWM